MWRVRFECLGCFRRWWEERPARRGPLRSHCPDGCDADVLATLETIV